MKPMPLKIKHFPHFSFSPHIHSEFQLNLYADWSTDTDTETTPKNASILWNRYVRRHLVRSYKATHLLQVTLVQKIYFRARHWTRSATEYTSSVLLPLERALCSKRINSKGEEAVLPQISSQKLQRSFFIFDIEGVYTRHYKANLMFTNID
jgi:hypothetical protein